MKGKRFTEKQIAFSILDPDYPTLRGTAPHRYTYAPHYGPGFSVRPMPLRLSAPTSPLPYSSAPILAMPSPVLLKTATAPLSLTAPNLTPFLPLG